MRKIKLRFMLIVLQYIYHKLENENVDSYTAKIMVLQDDIKDKLKEN